MAVYNQWQAAAQQHLAHLRQEDSVHQVRLVHQPQVRLAEAALEAHLAALEQHRDHPEILMRLRQQ